MAAKKRNFFVLNKLPWLSLTKWLSFMISIIIITLQIIPSSFSLIDKNAFIFHQIRQNATNTTFNDFAISDDSVMPDELQLFVDNIEAMASKSINGSDEYYVLLSSHLKQHQMAPQNNIIAYSLKNDRNVLYHCNNDKAGLGNNIYNYWFTRALAFYFNLQYQFVINKPKYIHKLPNTSKYIKNILEKIMYGKDRFDNKWLNAMNTKTSNKSVSRFLFLLPTYSNYTFIKYIIKQKDKYSDIDIDKLLNEYQTIQLYLLQSLISISNNKHLFKTHEFIDDLYSFQHDSGSHILHSMHWPWGTKWKWFYLNDVFRKNVIVPETFYVFNKYKHLLNMNEIEKYNKYDIVIHIRCGDMMSDGSKSSGFHTFSYYEKSMEQIMRNNNNNSNDKNITKKAYILLQLLNETEIKDSLINIHSETKSDEEKCNLFAKIMIPRMKMEIFDKFNYSMYLISDGSLHDDYYRLMTAPNVICSKSTFCTSATLSNINATQIIWPSKSVHNLPTENIYEIKNVMLTSNQIKKHKYSAKQIAEYVINN